MNGAPGHARPAPDTVVVPLAPGAALALAEEVVQSKEILKSNLAGVRITSRDHSGFRYQVMVWYRRRLIKGNSGGVQVTPVAGGYSSVRFYEKPTAKLYFLYAFIALPVGAAILDPSPNSWIGLLAAGVMAAIIWFVSRLVANKSPAMAAAFEARARRASPAPAPAAPGPFEQLRSLAQLRESGAITAADFEQARSAILAKLG